MEESMETTELPSTLACQHITPFITDAGVTAAVMIMFGCVEGSVRRFVMSTDDAENFASLIRDTLAMKNPDDR